MKHGGDAFLAASPLPSAEDRAIFQVHDASNHPLRMIEPSTRGSLLCVGATEVFVVRPLLIQSLSQLQNHLYAAIRIAGDAFRFGITRSAVAR
ncbi:MAG: hypothetical protein RL591_2140 [Planctomycetota bacterium]|jgi:hypothetical protein